MNSIVFAGSPSAAVTVLDVLVDEGFMVRRVVTQPDTRRGRGNTVLPTPVKKRALELGIEVCEDVDDLFCEGVDATVVVAYGRIIPQRLLDAIAQSCRVPALNVHFSLLPRWRGAAPVERAILAGDDRTGVCIMGMEATLDTGPVYSKVETTIEDDDTTTTLTSRLAKLGATALVNVLHGWPLEASPQIGDPTYAHKIASQDLVIDWNVAASRIARQVRAVPAYTMSNGRRLRITSAHVQSGVPSGPSTEKPGTYIGDSCVACGDGVLNVVAVQPEGKSAMSFESWANGARITRGHIFGGSGS